MGFGAYLRYTRINEIKEWPGMANRAGGDKKLFMATSAEFVVAALGFRWWDT